VGRDKGSLTEQQTKGTGRTTIQKRRIHRTNQQNRARRTEPLSGTEPLLYPPERRVPSPPPSSPPPEPSMTAHGMEYPIPCSVRPGGVSPPGCAPSWSPVKINPVLAKTRTLSTPYSIPSTSCPGPPLSG